MRHTNFIYSLRHKAFSSRSVAEFYPCRILPLLRKVLPPFPRGALRKIHRQAKKFFRMRAYRGVLSYHSLPPCAAFLCRFNLLYHDGRPCVKKAALRQTKNVAMSDKNAARTNKTFALPNKLLFGQARKTQSLIMILTIAERSNPPICLTKKGARIIIMQ